MAVPRLQAEDRDLLRRRAVARVPQLTVVATHDDVRRLALSLPEVAEAASGDLAFEVAGKRFVGLWRERVHPKKTKVPNPGVIVLPTADLGEKEALIASVPGVFTEPHYDGFKAVLVRLAEVGDDDLAEMVTDAWRAVAPPSLLPEVD